MRLNVFVEYGLLVLISIIPLQARTYWWKPEQVPGSARLALEDVRTVVLPAQASERLLAAVEDLQACWPVKLEQAAAAEVPSKQVLVLEREEAAAADTGGFTLRRKRTRVTLRAASDEALADGLYAICRELLGVRWYWAGDVGLEFVGVRAEHFPVRRWHEQPAFVQRTLYPVASDFGRRNGLNRRYSFNHNLARIFTQDVFESSPEAFAEIEGARQAPRQSAKYDPQPNFIHPRAVELAAQAARERFEATPQPNSFSLSINDNSLFDEGEATARAVARHSEDGSAPVSYFRERPNYTDLVFGFMNEVAEKVYGPVSRPWPLPFLAAARPSAPYLTALAYYWTEQSPSFPLHPQVMPVLTSDRAQWHDPVYREEDKALIRRWAESGAERIATWDYYFGAPYPYPRQFTRWIGESIRFLDEAGVDVFFSQLPSIWGLDGPKAWLTAELLRDPQQDPAELLAEYYENFFGPAAEPIREFYQIAEQTRDEREGTAYWIKFYKDEAAIELFPPATLTRMRECIDLALQRAQAAAPAAASAAAPLELDPMRFVQRVQIVSEAFAYTEAYAAMHRSRVQLVEQAMAALRQPPEGAAEPGALRATWTVFQQAKAHFDTLQQHLARQPMHQGFSTFNQLMQTDPMPLVLAALGAVGPGNSGADEADSVNALLRWTRAWHAGKARPVSVGYNPQLKHRGRELRNFLGPEVPLIDGWTFKYRASYGLKIEAARGQEAAGWRVENADIVSLSQSYPVIGERAYLLQIDASWQVSPDNRSWVQLNWRSRSGEKLATQMPLRLPNGQFHDRQPLQFAFISPPNAYSLRVSLVTNRQYAGDYIEIERVELGRLIEVSMGD